ncbi:MAG: hypothetical protein A2046_02015 [Bacteroidetes bacterium GWA2_30_7]|nr:MAG: hypothetical protein A2046_02015 [Bacteroidetes bacterium GWA2_30_7]
MIFVLIIIAFILIDYIILISAFIIGVFQIKKLNKNILELRSDNNKNLKFSIVIPFRNEEKNIENLITNLANQHYPKAQYQVILIDDFSTDNSMEIARKVAENHPQISIKILSNIISGKKEALKLGINNADFDLIVATDADCSHNKLWLNEIANFQSQENCVLIIAPVKIASSNSFFGKFQEIEFLSLQASSIGSAGINNPIMCNGANLVYQKKHFLEADIKNEIASGDDMFLLHSIKNNSKNKIGYLFTENAIVTTNSSINLKSFISQRIRWASKAKYYNDSFSKITALLVLTIAISEILLLVFSCFNKYYLQVFIIVFLIKSLIDIILLSYVNRTYKIKNLLLLLLPFEIVYLFYNITIGFLSLFSQSFTWKGRKYNY